MTKTRTLAWAVWAIASVFYAYQYILRVMPNIMMADIVQQFDMDVITFGQFSGIYYIGYTLMHLPVGIFLDRYGPRKVMPICILMTVVGLVPILVANFWVYPIIGRALIGMGSSAAILGVFKVIRLTFVEERFTRMLSFSVTIGLIGAIYGGGPVNYMCQSWGYQMVVGTFIAMGLILAAVTYFIIPDIEKKDGASDRSCVISDIKTVFGTPKVMAICLFAGMMVGPLEGFADVWGTGFLKKSYSFEAGIAASLPSLIFIGMCFGGPILSFIAERMNNYLGTIVAAGATMALSFTLLLSNHIPIQGISIMFIIVGICCAYQIIAIYKASTYVRDNLVGLTTAVANMIVMVFGSVFHSIIATVINLTGGIESSTAFFYGVGVIPLGLIIGSLGFMAIIYHDRLESNRALERESV